MTKTFATLFALALLIPSSAQAQACRNEPCIYCPAGSLHYGMIVKSGNIQGCYRPRRTNDGPVYSGYENPNRPIVNPHRIIMKRKHPVR